MDLMAFLGRLTQAPGVTGQEGPVTREIGEAFSQYADGVSVDKLQNTIAALGSVGPRFLVTAHQDEIGLAVIRIEDDGCLRFTRAGGVDMRILPALPVTVHTRSGPLPGVVGAKPPHLLTPEDQKQAVQAKDLYIDVGLNAERARSLVRPGDPVTLSGPLVKLADGRWAGKTLDDRACVCSMLEAAAWLKRLNPPARTFFVAASQEEVGSRGATTACWALEPDVAIVLDVTHAPTPGADKWETYPLDKPTITVGPNLHPELCRRLMETAKRNGVSYTVEPCGHVTATDAEVTQVSRAGVPTVLIGVPLRYMHTTVEMVDENVIREAGRLVALFIDELSRDWEGISWY